MGTTKFRLAEECMRLLSGGRIGAASKFHINEIKISVCQVANQLLKMEYMQTNLPLGERVPAGAAVMTYDNLPAYKYKNVSAITLPAAPIRLPRDVGCFSIFPTGDPLAEFIPLQMGQSGAVSREPLVSSIIGICYERFGTLVQFNQDITIPNEVVNISARLVLLDFTQYDDYTPLPINADHEWQIKQEVVKLYGGEPVADKLVDPRVKEQSIPIKEQQQP